MTPKLMGGYRPFDPHELRHAQLMIEINARCAENDKKHGGPEHDDTHSPYDWTRFITRYCRRAEQCLVDALTTKATVDDAAVAYESHLIDVAALSVAAVLSSRRKRNA